MFQQGDFSDSIHSITLTFKNPEIETRYSESRKEHLKCCTPGKIMIILLSLATTGSLIPPTFIYQDRGEISQRNGFIIVMGLTNASWILEFLIHYFPCFHFLSGFFFIIIQALSVILGTCFTVDFFAVAPGAISQFLLMLFVGLFYSKNWILATLAEIIGYLLIFIVSGIYYQDKMDPTELAAIDISMLVGIFTVSFIFYYYERLQRISVFQQWQTDQVSFLKN